MANYEKIVVIPASLEEDFHRFLQKGNGMKKLKPEDVKGESKVIKSIMKKPSRKETKVKNKKTENSIKKEVKWRKL